jgi:tryptophan-rich hypothetical protein
LNILSPKKLLNSKWTATTPVDKEKHFLVVTVEVDDDQIISECVLQAVMSKRDINIEWHDLKDPHQWVQGWK